MSSPGPALGDSRSSPGQPARPLRRRALPRRARSTAPAAARAPAAVGGSRGGASRFPPFPLSPGWAVRRRLSAAASSLGSAERGRSRRRLRRRKVSCGARGWDGEGTGLAAPLRCASLPPFPVLLLPGRPAGRAGLGQGAAARAACAGPGWAALPGASFLRHPGCKWPIAAMAVCLCVCESVRVCSAAVRSPVRAVPVSAARRCTGAVVAAPQASRAWPPLVALRKRRDTLETEHRLFVVWDVEGFHGVSLGK